MNELTRGEFLALKAVRDKNLAPFYCLRLTRALFASEAIKAMGKDAALLVQWVALREDELRYREPVRAWNAELENVLGFNSPKQLNETRRRAVEAGWLLYCRDHDRAIGEYLAVIPARFHDLLCKSALPESFPNTESEAERENEMLSENGMQSGKGNGKGSGKPSIPNPIPVKSEQTAKRFVPPSVQEVQEFARAVSLRIDPERFVDYFESVGWVIGKGKKPMKSWQAAARNWARNSKDQATQGPQRKYDYVNS